jgi:hypothetical protein
LTYLARLFFLLFHLAVILRSGQEHSFRLCAIAEATLAQSWSARPLAARPA